MSDTIQRSGRLVAVAALLLAIGLLSVGCSGTSGSATPADSGTDAAAEKATEPETPDASAPAAAPTVKLTEPLEGAELLAGDVVVEVETTGHKFVMPSNTNVPGEGHVHFTLDDRPFVMSTTPSGVIKDVKPGTHKLVAELVQNNTDSFDPPVEAEIEFVVK